MPRTDHRDMHSRHVDGIVIRPLRNGDAATVLALLDRAELALVDARHHVLVAYVPGDPRPAGIARLVRDGDAAEVTLAVADERIESALAATLAADARAAGISWPAPDRTRPHSLLRRTTRIAAALD